MLVYLVTNTINGKRYVGITTVGLAWRWKEHLSDARHDSRLALHCAIRKHSAEAFEIQTLEVLPEHASHDDLDNAERRWIKQLDTFGKCGYNMTPGGQAGGWCVPGRTVSVETRRKISERRKGNRLSPEHRQAIGLGVSAYYASHAGPNSGKKWVASLREKRLVNDSLKKKPVFVFDQSGLCVIVYRSLDDAVAETGLGHRVLSGNRKKYRPKFVNGVTYQRSNMTWGQHKLMDPMDDTNRCFPVEGIRV